MYRYFLINKPYGVLSQFTEEDGNKALGSLFEFPNDVYPIGRLDLDSEGLLVLTNNKSINQFLLDPDNKKLKTYWIEVEGKVDDKAIENLLKGVTINLKGKKHFCKAVSCTIISPEVPERIPPVNYKKHPNRTWLEIKITEGKNHQIRKMSAMVGYPTLRLIRTAVDNLQLHSFDAGAVMEMNEKDFFETIKYKATGNRKY